MHATPPTPTMPATGVRLVAFGSSKTILRVDQQYPPVFCTRHERGNAAGTTCTEIQYTNERRVGGWPGSFWTACGRESLAAAMGGTWTVTTLATNRGNPAWIGLYVSCEGTYVLEKAVQGTRHIRSMGRRSTPEVAGSRRSNAVARFVCYTDCIDTFFQREKRMLIRSREV